MTASQFAHNVTEIRYDLRRSPRTAAQRQTVHEDPIGDAATAQQTGKSRTVTFIAHSQTKSSKIDLLEKLQRRFLLLEPHEMPGQSCQLTHKFKKGNAT